MLQRLVDFIIERHKIYLRREAGEVKPWTADPLLQRYRFTNVYRELDKETVWIHDNWMAPHSNKNMWFAALVARHINWSPTLAALPYPVPWDPKAFLKAMDERARSGEQLFTGAYMINQSIPGGKGMTKHAYLERHIFSPSWKQRDNIAPVPGDTLDYAHIKLMHMRGLGSFMAAQVIADVKHTWLLTQAPDWFDWAASGPGSRRGMNLLLGKDEDSLWKEEHWRACLQWLRPIVNEQLPRGWKKLDGQNLQNCLCEFSKIIRGYSRTKFNGV